LAETEIADYDTVAEHLRALRADWEPAEAHGAFCGMACFSGARALQDWMGELLPDAEAEDVLARERQAHLQQVAADTLLKLEAGQMAFELLLPDADVSLDLRTGALADWCHGFMHGLMSVGHPDTGSCWDSLDSEVAREVVEDFSAITRAGVEQDADEEAEAALAELVEYVRVSVQLVYEEAQPARIRLAADRDAGAKSVGDSS